MIYEVNKYYVDLTPNYSQNLNNDIKYWNYYSDINYAIINFGNNWVATYKPELHADAIGIYFTSWSQGHYFDNVFDAKNYIKDKYIALIADKIDELDDLKETLNNI